MDKVKWGILGPGSIARKFAGGIQVVEEAELIAVGSRSQKRADSFADKYDLEYSYGNYEELVENPEIDVIYVATPHPFHKKYSILALEAGKSVLCEKPLAINAEEVSEMRECARTNQAFLMEAMWTRFLPVVKKVREWISDNKIGDVQMVKADFGFRAERDPEARLFNPELGGGALLDVGIYTISFASMIFKDQPSSLKVSARKGKTGIDEQTSIILGYEKGEQALLSCAIRTNIPQDAMIIGTEGYIEMPGFWHSEEATLVVKGEEEKVEIPFRENGFEYEIKEVTDCIQAGKNESEIMPVSESKAIIETMDNIRDQIDLHYPQEEKQ